MSQSCSTEQINALLDFLSEHRDLARGLLRSADGRARAKRLWEEIAQTVNSLGGSIKTVQQWQKVWTDRKHVAKKNAAALRRAQSGTGGGPSSAAALSQWELRILDIMGEGFGGPQTTARVPAFPTVNTTEEIVPVGPIASTSGNIGDSTIASEEILSGDLPIEVSLAGLGTSDEPSYQSQLENRSTTHATQSTSSRTFNRSLRRRTNLSDRLVQMEREKINILKNIFTSINGIEKAIIELVELKKNNL